MRKKNRRVEAMSRCLGREKASGIGLIIVGAWLWTVSISRTSMNGKSLLEWEPSLIIVYLKPHSYPYCRKMESCRAGPSHGIQIHGHPDMSWLGQVPFKEGHKLEDSCSRCSLPERSTQGL